MGWRGFWLKRRLYLPVNRQGSPGRGRVDLVSQNPRRLQKAPARLPGRGTRFFSQKTGLPPIRLTCEPPSNETPFKTSFPVGRIGEFSSSQRNGHRTAKSAQFMPAKSERCCTARMPSDHPFHRVKSHPRKTLAELSNRRRVLRFEQMEQRTLLATVAFQWSMSRMIRRPNKSACRPAILWRLGTGPFWRRQTRPARRAAQARFRFNK
jgi:hypothetical protein